MIRSKVPDQLVAGDTWRWTRAFDSYPAPTWSVSYYFENAAKQFSQVAIADGTSQAITIDAATSSQIPPGRYRWFARAAAGSIIETIDAENGWVDVLPDPAAQGTRDHRSWARRALEAVRATIENRASNDQLAMSIAGRSISRMVYAELAQMQKDLEAKVRTEESGGTAGRGRNIKVRLNRA